MHHILIYTDDKWRTMGWWFMRSALCFFVLQLKRVFSICTTTELSTVTSKATTSSWQPREESNWLTLVMVFERGNFGQLRKREWGKCIEVWKMSVSFIFVCELECVFRYVGYFWSLNDPLNGQQHGSEMLFVKSNQALDELFYVLRTLVPRSP